MICFAAIGSINYITLLVVSVGLPIKNSSVEILLIKIWFEEAC